MENEIEKTRKLMISIASSTGLNSNETLEISRQLDTLINQYESIKVNYENKNKRNLIIEKLPEGL